MSGILILLKQRAPPAWPTCDDVPAAGPAHLLLPALGVFGLQQVHHLGVVGDGGPVAYRRQRDGQVHTGVVVLS